MRACPPSSRRTGSVEKGVEAARVAAVRDKGPTPRTCGAATLAVQKDIMRGGGRSCQVGSSKLVDWCAWCCDVSSCIRERTHACSNTRIANACACKETKRVG
mmetsp:Transcript_29686/g.76677  ORF Transcript_29686/g.76677 Transcript_29686/m.76677 type:complete len:102 (-) Transcript_29686:244-549(-)